MVMASWVNKNLTILLSVDGAFWKNFSEETEWELVIWEMQDRQASASKIVSDNLKKILIWLNRVLVAARRGFDLNSLWHVGSFRCSLQIICCGIWDLVPQPGIDLGPPVMGAWSLIHWTTKEVPQ